MRLRNKLEMTLLIPLNYMIITNGFILLLDSLLLLHLKNSIYNILRKPGLKVIVTKAFYNTAVSIFRHGGYGWQLYSVKRIIFNHRIDSHVMKAQPVTGFDGMIEGVIRIPMLAPLQRPRNFSNCVNELNTMCPQ